MLLTGVMMSIYLSRNRTVKYDGPNQEAIQVASFSWMIHNIVIVRTDLESGQVMDPTSSVEATVEIQLRPAVALDSALTNM
jgi:hypothetical protein